MNATVRLCSAPTPGGPCQHPVSRTQDKCWQHDGRGLPTIKLDAPMAESTGFWEYQGCVLQAVSGARLVECLLHDHGEWEVAQALGADPPCAQARAALRSILQWRQQDEMSVLLPLAQYLRQYVPAEMTLGAKGGTSPVLDAFFEEVPITPELLDEWRANRHDWTVEAVLWLEEHGHDARSWTHGLGKYYSPKNILPLAQAGVDPIRLRALHKVIKPIANASWWACMHTDDVASFVKQVDPSRLAEYGAAARGHMGSYPTMSPSTDFSIIPALEQADRRGLTPQDFAQIVQRAEQSPGWGGFVPKKAIDALLAWNPQKDGT